MNDRFSKGHSAALDRREFLALSMGLAAARRFLQPPGHRLPQGLRPASASRQRWGAAGQPALGSTCA